MARPDLVLTKNGRTVAVVEAKRLPVTPAFKTPVRIQIETFAREAGAPWALLIDPHETQVFKHTQLLTCFPTEEVLKEVYPSPPDIVGELTLIITIDRLLHDLSLRREFLARHPELEELARDVADAESTIEASPSRR